MAWKTKLRQYSRTTVGYPICCSPFLAPHSCEAMPNVRSNSIELMCLRRVAGRLSAFEASTAAPMQSCAGATGCLWPSCRDRNLTQYISAYMNWANSADAEQAVAEKHEHWSALWALRILVRMNTLQATQTNIKFSGKHSTYRLCWPSHSQRSRGLDANR